MTNKAVKSILAAVLLAVMLLTLAACSGGTQGQTAPAPEPGETAPEPAEPEKEAAPEEPADAVKYENGGVVLYIPKEYDDLLIVSTENEYGELFSVTEKASYDAGQLQHPGEDWGDGWIFSISRVDETRLHELFCGDMSGLDYFANDGENYYLYEHPTDVRLVREDYSNISEESMAEWTKLNEWAYTSVKSAFADANGLEEETVTNTNLDICLNRIYYLDTENYEVRALSNGAQSPDKIDSKPYIARLLDGLTVKYSEDGRDKTDGEGIVLYFNDYDMYFYFFLGEGMGNYVMEKYEDGYEVFFELSYADGETVACEIMEEWYEALAAA